MTPFIYGLVDPRDVGHVRYVGMSFREGRPQDHARNARKGSTYNPHLMNWVRKIHAEGRDYEVIVLERLIEDAPREFVGFVERCYIKSLREIGHKLTNVALGGDGGNTNAHTVEVCARIGAASKGHVTSAAQRAQISASLMGHPVSDETKRKISEARRRHFENPENRRKRSESARLATTEETRRKISESGKGRIVTPETRKKISDTLSRVRRAQVKRD